MCWYSEKIKNKNLVFAYTLQEAYYQKTVLSFVGGICYSKRKVLYFLSDRLVAMLNIVKHFVANERLVSEPFKKIIKVKKHP